MDESILKFSKYFFFFLNHSVCTLHATLSLYKHSITSFRDFATELKYFCILQMYRYNV